MLSISPNKTTMQHKQKNYGPLRATRAMAVTLVPISNAVAFLLINLALVGMGVFSSSWQFDCLIGGIQSFLVKKDTARLFFFYFLAFLQQLIRLSSVKQV